MPEMQIVASSLSTEAV